MKKLALTVAFLFVGPYGLFAQGQMPNSQELMYEGKPVGPECILELVSSESSVKPVNLKGNACQEKQLPYNPEQLKHGFIGYTIKAVEPVMKEPYIFYKYVGKYPLDKVEMDLIEVQWSGGGTGSFSGLFLIELKDNSLHLIKALDQGDRCIGSVHDAKLTNKVLTYEKQVTSQGLYNALYGNKEPSVNLEDCAVCCIGKLIFKAGHVESLQFTGTVEDLKTKISQEDLKSAQACFDTFLLKTLESKKTSLTSDELNVFGADLKKQCFSKS